MVINDKLSGWWFEIWLLFSPIAGMRIKSDFHIVQRDRNHQPVIMKRYGKIWYK